MPQVAANGLNINYETLGTGEPLLLIIGFTFSLVDWGDKFPALLAQNYQVILMDNRDAGRSSQANASYTIADMADDATGLLNALGISQAHVFGVSMGGMIAQQFALRHPQNLKKLILGCTMAGGDCSQKPDPLHIGSVLMKGNVYDLLFPPVFLQVPTNKAKVNQLYTKAAPLHSQGTAREQQLAAFVSYDACADLRNIQPETLILHGDEDIVIPPANSLVLNSEIPSSSFQNVAGAGHGFCFSHADEAAQYIHDFLK